MKNSQFIETLIDLGLSNHEALVYFAALSIGSSSVIKIAQAAEIKRTTVYFVIASLQQKGLMNIELKGIKKLYRAESPEKVQLLIEQRKDKFNQLLPEYMGLYNAQGGESFMSYYQGLTSVKSIYNQLLKDIKPHHDYLVISDQEQWENLDQKFFKDFTERRSKLPIRVRVLLTDTPAAREYKKFEKNYHVEVRILPAQTKLTTNLVIIPKRVVIHQLTSPIIAIVIENKSVVQMHRESFEIMWNANKAFL